MKTKAKGTLSFMESSLYLLAIYITYYFEVRYQGSMSLILMMKRSISPYFLEALASLGSLLESESLIDSCFEILSNLGHISGVCSEYV